MEAEVRNIFPQARVVRWDRDTTTVRQAHAQFLDQFIRHQADVLVGTQMIAKGLDLPLVTVVGVVSADTGLHLPDFRAAERTFQLLTQVAGRAGRSELGGQVIVQTYNPEHYAIQAASHHDYATFYRKEITYRRELNYPPFSRLVQIVYSSSSRDRCQGDMERLKRLLELKIARLGLAGLDLIGPAPAFLERERGLYRWQLLVRGVDPGPLVGDLALPVGWKIDVDPISLI
ncbi:MAG: primosomal protein N' [Chloroflexi bacterium RBG_16_57_9]|nr:MAG: primosomal protein N' [Chloroflexi bacterium RBG_16_57_9]